MKAWSWTHNPFWIQCLNVRGHVGGTYTPEACAEEIYKHASNVGEPGKVFIYNSLHLQIALGMVTKITGLDAQKFLYKYLYRPANMTMTSYGTGKNPMVAAEIRSNMEDVDSFVRNYMAYKILPKSVINEMDTEYVQANKAVVRATPPVSLPKDFYWSMGHVTTKGYKKGDNIAPWVPMTVTIQEWGGATGWVAMIDRETDVYMAMV